MTGFNFYKSVFFLKKEKIVWNFNLAEFKLHLPSIKHHFNMSKKHTCQHIIITNSIH